MAYEDATDAAMVNVHRPHDLGSVGTKLDRQPRGRIAQAAGGQSPWAALQAEPAALGKYVLET